MLKHISILALVACSSFFASSSWALRGSEPADPAPICEEPIAGTVNGPKNCNCTSVTQSYNYRHWEKAAGPGGNGTMQNSSGGDIPYNGNPTTGSSGAATMTVPPGKCVTVVYHFSCCPRAGGTYACGTTGQVTYVETTAVCPP